jgi:hypothetical protein
MPSDTLDRLEQRIFGQSPAAAPRGGCPLVNPKRCKELDLCTVHMGSHSLGQVVRTISLQASCQHGVAELPANVQFAPVMAHGVKSSSAVQAAPLPQYEAAPPAL